MARQALIAALLAFGVSGNARAVEIRTNSVIVSNVPDTARWLTARRIEKIVDRIEHILEWDIRRVRATWYLNEGEFAQAHGLRGAAAGTILAVARRSDQSIAIGPRVTDANFDATFGHELAHVVLFQKYKSAIPSWLDEGLANFAARAPGAATARVDYSFLAQEGRFDIRALEHPFATGAQTRWHYHLSTAMVEMIASRCSLSDLLQLSVGSKLETYLRTTCEMQDLQKELATWVRRKAGSTR